MTHVRLKSRYVFALLIAVLIVTLITGYVLPLPWRVHAQPVQPGFNHFLSTHYDDDGQYDDNDPTGSNVFEAQQYAALAYPATSVSYDQTMRAYQAYLALTRRKSASGHSWNLVGPVVGNVPTQVTYTGATTTASGRVTAIAISSTCDETLCRVWVGAAGGGIWETDNGLAATPTWHSSSSGLASNAIGSIVIDPDDPTGATLYAGTGEENGSSDSEAGVGVYQSTNYGKTRHLVTGSIPAAKNRSIGAIAIDPTDANHIYIGTDVARHGASSVNGGRFTPPGAPVVGLYESTDGGKTFSLVFAEPSDSV